MRSIILYFNIVYKKMFYFWMIRAKMLLGHCAKRKTSKNILKYMVHGRNVLESLGNKESAKIISQMHVLFGVRCLIRW